MIKTSTHLIDFSNKKNKKTTPVFKDYFFEPSQISLQNILNFSKNLEISYGDILDDTSLEKTISSGRISNNVVNRSNYNTPISGGSKKINKQSMLLSPDE